MSDRLVQLRVRAVARDERRFDYEDPRKRFWSALESASTSKNERTRTESEYEAHLQNGFGPALTGRIANHLHQAWGAPNEQRMRPERWYVLPGSSSFERRVDSLAAVFFQFKLRGYSSLDFSVEIAGIRHLARLLDNNFDLFMMLMGTYIPASFLEAIPYYYPPDAISFDITADQETRDAFNYRGAPNRSLPAPAGGSAREGAIWLLMNATLLVPVLLALGICYVTYKGLADERATVAANLQRLLAHEEAFVKQNNERLQSLRKIEEQLIERGMQPPPPVQAAPGSRQQQPTP